MNLNKQIKAYRTQLALSQADLAAKVYVTRQTVSNWETGRSYHDVENLLLLATLFDVTLDELVTGDLDEMQRVIDGHRHLDWSYAVFAIIGIFPILLAASLVFLPVSVAIGLSGVIAVLLFIADWQLRRLTVQYHVKTYQEILAFMTDKRSRDPYVQTQTKQWGDKGWLIISLAVVWFVGLLFISIGFFK